MSEPAGATQHVSAVRAAVQRPWAAALLVLVIYGALCFLNSPRGTLGTDTGGKVATLRVMRERHTLDPDVGYWAARVDTTGRFHPLWYTTRYGRRWVNVTTLPVLYLAYPLYRVGGYRAALLIPMIGSIAAAFGARGLARRLGAGEARSWGVFWLTALASPLTLYAIDFWEHSVGVALVVWAIVVLLGALDRDQGGSVSALAAGLLFGVAATLRTESLVYAAVATAATCSVVLWRTRRPTRVIVVGLLVAVATALPVAAEAGVEQAVLHAQIRSSRATGEVKDAGAVSAGLRTREAVLTLGGLSPSSDTTAAFGGVLALCVFAVVVVAVRGQGSTVLAIGGLVGLGLLYLVRFSGGLGFIPGLVPTTPFATVGILALGRRAVSRQVAWVVAVCSLPLVWALQFAGGAEPQWGGRYILVSGVVLAVLGMAALGDGERRLRAALTLAAVGVTVFGLAWMTVRTHEVAHFGSRVARENEAVVFGIAHLPRELGSFYDPSRKWLTALGGRNQARAARLLDRSGVRRFGVLDDAAASPPVVLGPYRAVSSRSFGSFLGEPMKLTVYAES